MMPLLLCFRREQAATPLQMLPYYVSKVFVSLAPEMVESVVATRVKLIPTPECFKL